MRGARAFSPGAPWSPRAPYYHALAPQHPGQTRGSSPCPPVQWRMRGVVPPLTAHCPLQPEQHSFHDHFAAVVAGGGHLHQFPSSGMVARDYVAACT